MNKSTSWWAIWALALAMVPLPAWAQAISSTADEISYRIKSGDSLIGLGNRFFLKPDDYKIVERLNSLSNPDRLGVGSTIVIPTRLLRSTPLEAKVIAFKGRASVTRGGRAMPVAIQSSLAEGSVIETGEDGFLTLQLANGSKIALPSNSRIRIARMRTYLLTQGVDLDFLVERGRAETTATKLRDNRSRFRMRTPVAVSAVRGTVFRIGYDGPGSASLTEVVEGAVAVNLNATGARTSLPTGFGAAGLPDGKLKREELLPPPTFQSAGSAQRAREVTFALDPSKGAVGYHVQVANDRTFVNMVASARSAAPLVALGSLPAGNYFVRAMAIAPSGLEGLPRTEAFERKLQSLVARKLPGAGRRWQLEWEVGGSKGSSYRVQLFDVRQPAMPVIDELAMTGTSLSVSGLPSGIYTWRVGQLRTIGGKLQQSWTPSESFTVEN